MEQSPTGTVHEITPASERIAESYSIRHGWLTPEGVMYDVGYEGHEEFAENRGGSQDRLYVRGWVKLSDGNWYGDAWREDDIKVTQRQYDYIYAWHEHRSREVPKTFTLE
jgi:hypothetical protein